MNECPLRSPYQGLRPFLEEDWPYFFGRDRERKLISANLRTRRLTLLYGPSGVGKSSVINAGVLSHLRQHMPLGCHKPANTRTEVRGYFKPVLVVVVTKWQADPLESLQGAILKSVGDVVPWNEKDRMGKLTLPEMIREITTFAAGAELLVILDQFEEYFVYHSQDEITEKFDEEFSRTLINQDLRANFLISIREDWLARLDRFKGRIPNLFENVLRIEHLKHEAADKAMRGPVDTYNQSIPDPGNHRLTAEITDDFVKKALEQLEGIEEEDDLGFDNPRRSGAKSKERRIQTSRLQIVLEDLWDRVKSNSPPRLDGKLLPKPDTAKSIIESHLNKSLSRLTPKESAVAASFFPFLTTSQGTKFADSATGLADRANHPPEVIAPVLKRLTQPDLKILDEVAPAPGMNQRRFELTSDALATHILSWSRNVRTRLRRKKIIRTYIFSILALIVIGIVTFALLKARQQRSAANSQAQAIKIERDNAQRALAAVRKLDKEVPYSKAVLRGHGNNVASAVFTPNGDVLTASFDGSAILWNIESADPIHEFNKDDKEKNPLLSAAVSPKGDVMVTASLDGTVTLWSLDQGKVIKQLRTKVGHHVTDISFSRHGDFIAAANTVGEVIVWNSATGDVVKEIPGNNQAIRQIAFSPKDTFLAAASYDHTVRIWRSVDWSLASTLIGHTDKVNGLAFSADEQFIATAGKDATVRVWNPSTGEVIRVLMGHAQSVNSVDFDRKDRNQLLSASDDTTARVWDVAKSKSTELIGHTDKVLSASFNPDGNQVVTGSRDHVVRIWAANTGRNLVELNGHLDEVTYVTYSADGKYILTASNDATARVWFATESGPFAIEQPKISATPNYHNGPCPVTIGFIVRFTATSGTGTVVYGFRGSGGVDGPTRELPFDEPDTKYVNWYRRIYSSQKGAETIEVINPKGIKSQRVGFTVICKAENASPTPTPTPSPPPPT